MVDYIPIAVAFKKRWGSKIWVKEFRDQRNPDKIISKRSNVLPKGSEILEIGVGSGYYEKYIKKYGK